MGEPFGLIAAAEDAAFRNRGERMRALADLSYKIGQRLADGIFIGQVHDGPSSRLVQQTGRVPGCGG
jgi:hypothetical protein